MTDTSNPIDAAFEKWLARMPHQPDPGTRLLLAAAFIAGWSEGYDDGCLATCRAYEMSGAGINALRVAWGKEPVH